MINQNVKGKCTAHEKNKKTEYKCKILKYAIWLKWVKGGFQMRRENIKIAIYLYLNHKGWKCNQWNYINLFMSYWKYLLVQHKFTYRKMLFIEKKANLLCRLHLIRMIIFIPSKSFIKKFLTYNLCLKLCSCNDFTCTNVCLVNVDSELEILRLKSTVGISYESLINQQILLTMPCLYYVLHVNSFWYAIILVVVNVTLTNTKSI